MINEQFEHNLRKKIASFEKEPPINMWAKIEAELNDRPQWRPLIWKRYAAIAAMVLLLVGSTFFMFNHNNNTFSPNPPTLSVQHKPTPAVVVPIQPQTVKRVARKSEQRSISSTKKIAQRSRSIQTVQTATVVESNANEQVQEATPVWVSEEPQKTNTIVASVFSDKSSSSEPATVNNAVAIDQDKQQEAINKFLSDGEQAQLALERGKQNNTSLLALGVVAKGTPASTSSGLTNGGNTFSNRAIANLPNEQNSNVVPGKTFHLIPISVGVTIQKELGKGFSLETGLMYTFLYSTFEKIKDPAIGKDQQSLHYLGIPLALKYEIFSFDKFYLFAKLGAMLEGNIYGEVRRSIIYPYTTFSQTEKIRDEKLQTSLFIAPGIGYEITRSIHLSLEPSAQYYIPNGSNLSTIRTDQPFAFNLRLGISYNF